MYNSPSAPYESRIVSVEQERSGLTKRFAGLAYQIISIIVGELRGYSMMVNQQDNVMKDNR